MKNLFARDRMDDVVLVAAVALAAALGTALGLVAWL